MAFARELLVWWSVGACTRAAAVLTAGGGDVSVPRCEDDVEVAALPKSCGRHVLAAGAASRRCASSWSRAFCWRRLALLLSQAAWSAPRLVFCPLGAGLGFELLSLESRILLRCVWRCEREQRCDIAWRHKRRDAAPNGHVLLLHLNLSDHYRDLWSPRFRVEILSFWCAYFRTANIYDFSMFEM